MEDATSEKVTGKNFAFSHPFANQWHLVPLVAAIVVWVAYRYELGVVKGLFSENTLDTYYNAISYGPAALLLLVMFWIDKQCLRNGVRFVGDINKTLIISCFSAVLAVYLSVFGLTWLMDMPREPYMQTLFKSQTTTFQIAVYIASLILFTPIVEEILFRHFVLSVIPFKRNVWLAALAIIASAVVFTLLHMQYLYWITYAELFAFAVVAGVARVMSRGMLLPIMMHAFAIVVALLLNVAAGWLEGTP